MKTISASKPLIFDNKTIIPIEETIVYGKSVFKNSFIFCSKKPFALIILSEENTKAFNMKFEEIQLETLLDETNGLKELLNDL